MFESEGGIVGMVDSYMDSLRKWSISGSKS